MDHETLIKEPEQTPPKKGLLKEIFATVEMLAVAATIILVFFTLFARITVVEGASMNDTLTGGDKLLVSDLFYTPSRGDIVILQHPSIDGGNAIVKRVIATGGDTVTLSRDGVYVNGQKLAETDGSLGYTVIPAGYRERTITVEEDSIFVLGDNRPISYDSEDFGTVDARSVIGKVIFRIAPLSSFGTVK